MEEAAGGTPPIASGREELRSALQNMKIDEAIIGLITTVFSKELGYVWKIEDILKRFDDHLGACMRRRRIDEGIKKEIDEAFIISPGMEKVISDCFEEEASTLR
jgi:hypothetical protein